MMSVLKEIQEGVRQSLAARYGADVPAASVQVKPTPPEFPGQFSVVVFPFAKLTGLSPDAVAHALGADLEGAIPSVTAFNVVKGFVNLHIGVPYWQALLRTALASADYGRQPRNGEKVMVEYASPNTNKPLHLGHIRNILLGWSCSQLLEAAGYEVVKVQVVNDRGVAICKSMYAWQTYANGDTPATTGIKSDHFVGDYYVLFEQKAKAEYEAWQQTPEAQALCEHKRAEGQSEKDFFKNYKNKWFNDHSALGGAVRQMLLLWEQRDPDTRALWEKMNNWVYAGFDQTYADLEVGFDKLYYESNTYLLGKDIVEEGLAKQVFYRKPDGSVWIDLSDAGHDEKVVLRADGTSVYITQDLGTARMRYADFGVKHMVYVVADEQNYHFAVLFEVLRRLGEPYADGLHHLSYGLVELPTGRMKTREGTVVDADDLIAEVKRIARTQADERGELQAFSPEEQERILHTVAMGALKFFMLKVHPKKKMIFNPDESVDLQGQTGPYIQYSYVRINGLMRRVQQEGIDLAEGYAYSDIQPQEYELLMSLHEYPAVLQQAAQTFDPSLLANFCYQLAKSYHRFWHDLSVFNAASTEARAFRLLLSQATGQVLQNGMLLLGVQMPERM